MKEGVASYRITDIQEMDRPRERLERLGPMVLSDAELLAILLRVGIAGENAIQVGQRLIDEFDGLYGIYQAPFEEVVQVRGIGRAKAAQIKAAIELGRRLSVKDPNQIVTIHSPGDAANEVLYEMGALGQEELRVMLLNVRNQVLKTETIYRGSVNTSQVRIGEIFKSAVRRNAVSIIVIHNHPSGDPTPSPDDVAITRGIIQAGKLLDIEVLDHLVIGQGRYTSMKERGLGFG